MLASKRKLFIFGVGGLIAIAVWMFISWSSSAADETHRRNLKRYGDSYFRLQHVEQWLGGDFSKLVGVQALKTWYSHKADAERQALLASGYFVTVHAAVTNLASQIDEIGPRLRQIGDDPQSLTVFDTQSNNITIFCRPQYAPAYQEALQKR